jgi:type VI secretion system secreted protein VgrG
MSHVAQLKSEAMPSLAGMPALEFRSIRGHESLGDCFEYYVRAITPDLPVLTSAVTANVDYKALLGKELTVDMEVDQSRRQICGLVTRARFVASEDRRGVYEFVIEPWVVLAKRSSDFKIFQNQSALEIVREVLGDYPFSHDNRTSNQYPTLDFQVQYGEDDYSFINRLMAEWGIYFFFEHSDSVHRMVLVDEPGAHLTADGVYAQLSYYPPGHKVDEEYVDSFEALHGLQTGQWVTQDFDFRVPKATWEAVNDKPRKTGHADMERFSWPSDIVNTNSQKPAVADQETQARHLTRMRMEEAGSPGQRAHGAGMLRGLAVGTTFSLGGHPHEKSNGDYLLVSQAFELQDSSNASSNGDVPEYYCRSEFTAMPAKDNYRMPTSTDAYGRLLKPRTHGPQTAVVTGPKGREIYTDSYGRVKVGFHWNRYCSKDEKSSCWVRVASPWAGNNFGGISVPRIGQEVIVDFENGDPDRPIITGRVYNALNMPPWELPANQTQSGILTRSTEGGGPANANAFRFEDMKGKEEIWLHAERNHRSEVEHDESHWVGHNRTKKVDKNESTTIGASRSESVGASHSESIGGDRSVSVNKTQTNTVKSDITITSVEGEITIEAATKLTLKVGSSSIEIVDGDIKIVGPTQVDINP